MPGVFLVRYCEIVCETTGGCSLYVWSDQPDDSMAIREVRSVVAGATPSRVAIRFRLAGTTKGKLFKWEVAPVASLRLFSMRIYAKQIGLAGGEWAWFSLPVPPTSDEWSPIKLPIEATAEEWSAIKLPIEATAEDWSAIKLPIDPTSDEWSAIKLPIETTPDMREWVELPVAL
jgi:hypothetical protein